MSVNGSGTATELLVEAARTAAPALRLAEGVQLVWEIAVQPSTATWKRAALVAAMTSDPQFDVVPCLRPNLIDPKSASEAASRDRTVPRQLCRTTAVPHTYHTSCSGHAARSACARTARRPS